MMPSAVKKATANILLYTFLLSQQAGLVYGGNVVSAQSTTNVYQSTNGTTIVEISTANSQGLSHNKFHHYNVDSQGVVLNNTTASGLTHSSDLAGSIPANQYSVKQADIILNEVVTTNPSELSGYTEVVGKNADVVVANPNGITCNGCGFINTNQVSLTTGNPMIDGTGALNGFDVQNGTISIGRDGADLTNQQKFNIVARKIVVDGHIVMDKPDEGSGTEPNGTLQLVSGTNQWDYETGNVVETSGDSNTPDYGIDSTVFGGMYAGRITFRATENGVGVKMLGNAASSSDDFVITADGRIEIKSKIKSAKDINIIAEANVDEVIISEDTSGLSADNNIVINAVNSDLTLSNSTIYAESSIDIDSNNLTDANSSERQRVANTGSINIDTSGNLTTSNSIWKSSAGSLDISSNGDVSTDTVKVVSDSASIISDTGDINLANSSVETEQNITLRSTAGDINLLVGSGANPNDVFVKSINGNIDIDASNNLVNTGLINSANGLLDINSDVFNNSNNVQSNGTMTIDSSTINNSAVISTLSDLNVSGDNAALDGEVRASGSININLTDALSLNILKSSQNITANSNSLTVNPGGELSSLGMMTLSHANIQNSGLINSVGNSTITATSMLNNSGNIQSDGLVNINDGAGNVGVVNLLSNSNLAANAVNIDVSTLDLKSNAKIDSDSNIDLNVSSLVIDDAVITGNVVDIDATSLDFRNSASISSATDMNLDVPNLTLPVSTSRIIGATSGVGNVVFNIQNNLQNNGLIHSGNNLTVNSSNIVNSNTAAISSLNNLTLAGTTLYNQGLVFSSSSLGLNFSNSITNDSNGTSSLSGEIYSDGNISITTNQLTNRSEISSQGDISINASNIQNINPFSPTKNVNEYTVSSSESVISQNCSYDFFDAVEHCHRTHQRIDRVQVDESYPSDPLFYPIITARNLSVTNFNNVNNTFAIISALNNLTISSSNAGAVFTNQSGDLENRTYDDRYTKTVTWSQTAGGVFITSGPHDPGYSFQNRSLIATQPIPYPSGVFAGTMYASGFSLVNKGSPSQPQTTTTNAQTADSGVVKLQAGSNDITQLSIPSLSALLPSNPNGYFVFSSNPTSEYLVETNPLYNTVTNGISTKYFEDRYGYSPEERLRRLGDANYESYLVEKQLTTLTGSNILYSGFNRQDQFRQLMEQGAQQADALGFEYGKEPSPVQLANLTEDIVWVVSTVVNGETVLAPKVFLSSETRALVNSGAVISANTLVADLDSVENTGGTIKATDDLTIQAKNDIVNTSGTISGKNVNLKSTEGSITTKRYLEEGVLNAVAGKESSISGENVTLEANKDINILSSSISATNDASLTSGGDINVGTQELVTVTGFDNDKRTETKNLKSSIDVGNDLSMKSGNDIVLAGTDVNVGNNADINAENDFKILDVVDKVETVFIEERSGFGVGGGLWGKEKTTTTTKEGNSVASSMNIGGNLNVSAGNEITVRGSDIKAGGNIDLDASKGVAILDGINYKEVNKSTETMTIGKLSSSGLSLSETEKRNEDSASTRSQASNITAGKNLNIASDGDITMVGSNVSAGEDLSLKGDDVNILAGRNTDYSKTTVETTRIGVNFSKGSSTADDGSASTGFNVDFMNVDLNTTEKTNIAHSGSQLKGDNVNITANSDIALQAADIQATNDVSLDAGGDIYSLAAEDISTEKTTSASSSLGINLSIYGSPAAGGGGSLSASAKTSTENSTKSKSTGVATLITAGGDITRKAEGSIVDQGTQFSAGGDINTTATSYTELELYDSETSTSFTTDSETKIGATFSKSAGGGSAGLGVDVNVDVANLSKLSKTAKTASYNSGGNINFNIKEDASFLGTDMDSAGDININAGTLTYSEARDIHQESSQSSNLNSSTSIGVGVGSSVSESGISSNTSFSTSNEALSKSTAKTGSMGAGGNININTKGDASFVGTELSAVEGVNIDSGGDVSFESAKDTSSYTSSKTNTSVGLELSVNKLAAGGANQTGNVEESSLKNNVSSINSSSINITSRGDSKFVGTELNAVNDVTIDSTGDVTFESAKDDYSYTSTETGTSVGIELSADKFAAGFSNQIDKLDESSLQNTVSAINSSSINITSKGDATFVGTELNAKNEVNIDSAGDVTFEAAKDEHNRSSSSTGTKIGFEISKDKFAVDLSPNKEDGVGKYTLTNKGADILSSTGNITIKSGEDMTLEAATLTAGSTENGAGVISLDAKNDINILDAVDITKTTKKDGNSGFGVGGGIWGSKTTEKLTEEGKSVGSKITAGNNIKINSGNEVTVRGSDITARGNIDLDATNGLTILDGINYKTEKTKTETVAFGKILGPQSKTDASANADASGESNLNNTGHEGSASAGANASASASVGIAAMQVQTENEFKFSGRSKASNIRAGNNLNLTSGGDVTMVGANVGAGNDINITGDEVNILAGRNVDYAKKSVKTATVGLMFETNNTAGANAQARGNQDVSSVSGSASANAEAKSDLTVDLMTITLQSKEKNRVTHTGSQLRASNINIKSKNDIALQAANIAASNDVNLDAGGDLYTLAAEDTYTETSDSTKTSVGLYASVDGNASASAEAGASAIGGGASVDAQTGTSASVGVRQKTTVEKSTYNRSTGVGSTITAGGNINRKAEGAIVDQGTQLSAAGDINTTGQSYTELALYDSESTTHNKVTNENRVGVSFEAYASADAAAGTTGAMGGAAAGASVGGKVQVKVDVEKSNKLSKTAKTASYQSGGNINFTIKEDANFLGTDMSSGGDINIDAGTLTYAEARDINIESSESYSVDTTTTAGVGVGATLVDVEVSNDTSVATSKSDLFESTAKTGSMGAGGNINIKTKGDATFVGTDLDAGNDISIDSGGDVSFKSAKDIRTFSSLDTNSSLNVQASADYASTSVSNQMDMTDEYSLTNNVANISSGGGNISIKSANDINLEGTNISADSNDADAGFITLDAKNSINMLEAKDVEKSRSLSTSVDVEVAGGTTSGFRFGFSMEYDDSEQQTGKASNISGKSIVLNADTIRNQEAELQADNVEKNANNIVDLKKTDIKKAVSFGLTTGPVSSEGNLMNKKKKKDSGSSSQRKTRDTTTASNKADPYAVKYIPGEKAKIDVKKEVVPGKDAQYETRPAEGPEYIEKTVTTPAKGSEYIEKEVKVAAKGPEYIEKTVTTPAKGSEYIEKEVTVAAKGSEYIEKTVTTPAKGTEYVEKTVTTPAKGTEYIEKDVNVPAKGKEYIEREVVVEAVGKEYIDKQVEKEITVKDFDFGVPKIEEKISKPAFGGASYVTSNASGQKAGVRKDTGDVALRGKQQQAMNEVVKSLDSRKLTKEQNAELSRLSDSLSKSQTAEFKKEKAEYLKDMPEEQRALYASDTFYIAARKFETVGGYDALKKLPDYRKGDAKALEKQLKDNQIGSFSQTKISSVDSTQGTTVSSSTNVPGGLKTRTKDGQSKTGAKKQDIAAILKSNEKTSTSEPGGMLADASKPTVDKKTGEQLTKAIDALRADGLIKEKMSEADVAAIKKKLDSDKSLMSFDDFKKITMTEKSRTEKVVVVEKAKNPDYQAAYTKKVKEKNPDYEPAYTKKVKEKNPDYEPEKTVTVKEKNP
ncbi:hemagglutinin repeat-containing protein, partial [Endozoicomonas elysicola]